VPAGLSLAVAKTFAVGGTGEFVVTGPVAVHEASSRAVPATKTQPVATRCLPGLPCPKRQFDPSGPMMMPSLVLAIEARKFTTSLPNGETRQEQKSYMPCQHLLSRQSA
jgi:hypothetical protein